jgi:F420-dependent oxidoreductase-like protein
MDLADVPDPVEKFETLVQRAVEAEQAGFDSVWLYDHFHPVPIDGQEPVFECWTTIAALARETSRVRLGQMVTCNGYRPPSLLAKMTSCIDVASHGRLILGIGAGWHRREFEAYGYPFPETPVRLRQLGEAVQVLKAMWTEDEATFEGRYVRLQRAINQPKPVQRPHPPLWIGGGGERVTLKLVARHADGCNVGGGDVAQIGRKLAVLRDHCDALGRDYASITRSTHIEDVVLGDSEGEVRRIEAATARRRGRAPEDERGPFHGPAHIVAERLRAVVDAGIDYLLVYIANMAEPGAIRRFAEEVIPLVERG